MQNTQTVSAANHFLSTYADEIKAGEDITADAIYLWWVATKDQYPGVKYGEVENLIFQSLK